MLLLPDLLDDLICVIAARLPELADLSSLAAASRRMRALLLTRVKRGRAVHRTSLERLGENLRALNSMSSFPISRFVKLEALRGNAMMKTLDLSNTCISDWNAAAKEIGEALAVNGVLKTLNLCRNDIGDKGAAAIGEALAVNGVLKTLWLGGNKINDEGAAAIGEALAVNGVLTDLNLWDNIIGDEGAKALASALRVNGGGGGAGRIGAGLGSVGENEPGVKGGDGKLGKLGGLGASHHVRNMDTSGVFGSLSPRRTSLSSAGVSCTSQMNKSFIDPSKSSIEPQWLLPTYNPLFSPPPTLLVRMPKPMLSNLLLPFK